MDNGSSRPLLVLVEPFSGGSHEQMLGIATALCEGLAEIIRIELPAKKWHWRLRASSMWAAHTIPSFTGRVGTLFCSSMLNVAELMALRPDLRAPAVKIVLYFHENQLAFPKQHHSLHSGGFQTALATTTGAEVSLSSSAAPSEPALAFSDRDFQFGWAQVMSCLVVDVIAFNSSYNLASFVDGVPCLFRMIPEKTSRPDAASIIASIVRRAIVAHFPLPHMPRISSAGSLLPDRPPRLRIVWPHRWEYDKGPEAFFACMASLQNAGVEFEVVVLGEAFSEIPPCFMSAHVWLAAAGRIAHWGYASSREQYVSLLASCDVVVSTALHEFFGVSTLEAIVCGCYPLLPADLAYPEVVWPNSEEASAHAGALDKLRTVLALGPVTGIAPPQGRVQDDSAKSGASSGSAVTSNAGKRAGADTAKETGVRRGDPHFRPGDRDTPCPHLYLHEGALLKSLLRLARDTSITRTWKCAMRRAWREETGQDCGAAAVEEMDGREEPAVKRSRLDEVASAGRVAAAVSRFTRMDNLYRALLLPEK